MVTSQTDLPKEPPRLIPPEHLQAFPLFAGLPPERLTVLAAMLVEARYPVGEMIFSYGSPGDRIFFVCQGTAEVSLTDNLNHTEIFGTVAGGDCVGEVAVFGDGVRTADGRVTEDLVTLELRREDVDRFLDECPEARRLLLTSMAQRLEAASHRDRHHLERVSKALERRRAPSDHRLARLVRILGSPWFLAIQVAGSAIWIALNQRTISIDPPPYSHLGLFLTAEALAAALLILRYQNREEDDDQVRDAAQDRAADEINRRLDELLKRIPPASP